ncbi:Protein NUCLEAR FUSION DEFECTIVE 4 [Camellia lanceoleosa]|uniref:Protein NUCLEAR FUSION DEFECTIVE 4 n=1 Tax=Camellia lanceoleosa TaxID=1840588 RepID=A0ACC0IDN1_9ERIC|nr:Protein NUCLEAR FUSION DEFECTIVE 4 [Camellia lanceoleosa]
MLGVANDSGENVGIFPGIACNKFSPWIVLLIGAVASFFRLWSPLACCQPNCSVLALLAVFCLAYLLTTTILSHFIPLSDTVSYTFLVIMVLLLMAPLAIPVKMTLYPSNRSKLGTLGRPVGSSDQLNQAEGDVDKSEPLLTPSTSTTNIGSFHDSDSVSEVDMLLAEGEGAVKKKRRPKRGEDFTFREAIVKADFWLLFFVYFAGVGSGVTILNNLAQIGIAQGAEDTTVLLSLFSFFNFVGRLGGGIVSEHFVG